MHDMLRSYLIGQSPFSRCLIPLLLGSRTLTSDPNGFVENYYFFHTGHHDLVTNRHCTGLGAYLYWRLENTFTYCVVQLPAVELRLLGR